MMQKLWMLLLLLVAVVPLRAATIDFVLVLDESGSMEVASPFSDRNRLRVDAAKLFVELCGPADRVGIIGFGDRITYHTGHTMQGVDAQWKSYLVQRISSIGGNQAHTDMLGALRASLDLLQSRQSPADKTFVIFLTDGKVDDTRDIPPEYLERYSVREYSDRVLAAANELGARNIPVLCVGLGPEVDENLLGRIAGATKGRAYRARTAPELQEIYSDIFVSLADRFSRRAQGASSPVPVQIEPELKEFIALAFPPDFERRRAFQAGLRFQKDGGSMVEPTERTATKSWALARLRDPAPGNWQVHFDPRLKVDILLVKHAGCRINVVAPSAPEYPPGPVALEVTLTDPRGAPVDTCAGAVDTELTGPDGAAPVKQSLSHTGTGRFTGRTVPLDVEGEYQLKVRSFSPGGKEFANERSVTFRIKQVPVRPLSVTILRPDAPAYLAGGAVPVEVQVKSEDGTPLATGEASVTATLTGPGGPVRLPPTREDTAGVFKAWSPALGTPGTYSLGITGVITADPRTAVKASRSFAIQLAPPEKLQLDISRPVAGAYYPGALELAATLSRAAGGALSGADATVEVDLAGPGVTRKYPLAAGAEGFRAQTQVLTRPGRYRASFRGTLKADARSFVTRAVDFRIQAAVLQVSNMRLVGEYPLFVGEPFELQFELKAAGTTGTPELKATFFPPVAAGEAPVQVDLAPERLESGAFRVAQEKTALGAGRVDLTAKATSAGNQPVTTSVSVPIETFLDVHADEASLPSERPSTYELGLLSLFPDPVTVTGKVDAVAPEGGGAGGSMPALAPVTSVALTRPETADDLTAFPLQVEPGSASFGSYRADVTLSLSGRYPEGGNWSRTRKVKSVPFILLKAPAGPWFWLLLLAAAGGAFMLRPNFAGCWVKVGDQRIPIGSLAGTFASRVGLGGPDQPVAIEEDHCTPVVLKAGWMGKYERVTDEGSFALRSGDEFTVGRTNVQFFRGPERVVAPKAPGGGAPPPPEPHGSVDDIA